MNVFVPVQLFLREGNQRNENQNQNRMVRLLRINLRQKLNIFDLPNAKFLKNFRVTKETFIKILQILDLPVGVRSTRFSPVLQLAVTLNFLGSGGYQRQVGVDWSAPMGQSTIFELTTSTLSTMERKLCPLKIKFNPLSSERTKEYFYSKYRIPSVIGCIDGSHIMILRPSENEHIFFNRKGRHSINAMIICDHRMRVTSINAKYGGRAHDSFVWRQSAQREILNSNYCNANTSSWLLGDSGYPLEPFLLTPYRNVAENSPEAFFNNVHSKARSIVERCIGVMKNRWRCIMEERKLRYLPKRSAQIVNVCAALHNFCLEERDPLPADSQEHLENILNNGEPMGSNTNEGSRLRNEIRDSLWANR